MQSRGWVGPLATMSNLTAVFPSGGTGRSSGRVLVEESDYSCEPLVETAVEWPLKVGLASLGSGSVEAVSDADFP